MLNDRYLVIDSGRRTTRWLLQLVQATTAAVAQAFCSRLIFPLLLCRVAAIHIHNRRLRPYTLPHSAALGSIRAAKAVKPSECLPLPYRLSFFKARQSLEATGILFKLDSSRLKFGFYATEH